MYQWLLRPLLFGLGSETVHRFVFFILRTIDRLPFCSICMQHFCSFDDKSLEKNILGLSFKNPVGLAAGFDKDAIAIDALASCGFGFIETGTVTPLPQSGNPKPRLFRLLADRALVNRMGFNNDGAEIVAARLKKWRAQHQHKKKTIIVGGNIGKNKSTPNDQAKKDYAACLHALHAYVDYFVVNVSSPNTPGLRNLQNSDFLLTLLHHLYESRSQYENPKPILLKISPDLSASALDDVLSVVRATKIDGIVATNTTLARNGLCYAQSLQRLRKIGDGGLSGAPLHAQSLAMVRYIRQNMGEHFPIIGVGGIMSTQDALAMLNAGADLLQVYTGFVYGGPFLSKRINKAIFEKRA